MTTDRPLDEAELDALSREHARLLADFMESDPHDLPDATIEATAANAEPPVLTQETETVAALVAREEPTLYEIRTSRIGLVIKTSLALAFLTWSAWFAIIGVRDDVGHWRPFIFALLMFPILAAVRAWADDMGRIWLTVVIFFQPLAGFAIVALLPITLVYAIVVATGADGTGDDAPGNYAPTTDLDRQIQREVQCLEDAYDRYERNPSAYPGYTNELDYANALCDR